MTAKTLCIYVILHSAHFRAKIILYITDVKQHVCSIFTALYIYVRFQSQINFLISKQSVF
jgi:hypothetical protein